MPSKDEEADLAQAYRDLTEAEKTAATLEAQLNSLEQKLDDFLTEHDKPEVEGEPIKKNDVPPGLPRSNKDGTEQDESP